LRDAIDAIGHIFRELEHRHAIHRVPIGTCRMVEITHGVLHFAEQLLDGRLPTRSRSFRRSSSCSSSAAFASSARSSST
jgi:hypothetical protein